ncbi:ATP-dependent zinc metalloprotease FtsH homolog (chloroplast) [Chlorella vulgaris] [Rhizoctonia solani]|uniref:ATP-dependent zinc metalloprotease FtsH homolog (Chloroplast) [Chlorella vulgaris] n=1 Tax=Rhizoctonia solani TaxID=456999 RepID=A0A0K6FQL5_9AGAM|nr:ATP-dependent zinc metalloprotease FtsH homolog (chloroplast) [Chlorella vulgaris] [Rhizoctonia solani]
MADHVRLPWSSIPLSSPALLNLYTLCIVIITASLAIWGPQILSSVVERAKEVVSSNQSDESNDSKTDEDKDKDEKKSDEPTKKWKRKTQIWDYGWEDVDRPKNTDDDDKDMLFFAINRSWGRNSNIRDDHLWIQINSPPLAELLRFEFKHVEGLLEDKPGIDARELYTGRDRLAELAAQAPPEEENKTEEAANKDEKTDETKEEASTESTTKESENKDESDKKETKDTKDTKETKEEDDRPMRDVFSDEQTPNVPDLSKAEYDQALRELKLLHDFMISEFQKVEARLEKLRADDMISWRLLWTFFKHGQRIETIHASSREKVCFIMDNWDYVTDDDNKMVFEVRGRWLEWTGFRFAEQRITRQVSEFSGLKKAAQLPVRHLSDESLKALITRGRIYNKYAGVHHLNYNSNIIQMTPMGPAKTRAEGRLMVDTASFRRINPNSDRWEYDDPRYFSAEKAQNDGASSASWRTTLDDDDEDIALLPPTLHGWSFIAKKWGEILVEHLSPVPFQPHIFNHLVLRDDYKSLIRSLVDAHAGKGEAALLTDVVTGKGGGLVIVLHGKPGTGKTLTAEAVSEHLERPLYTVSSGELGVAAADLETKLRDTLDVATLWKAVLLIDEADVFLEARSSHELQRNALVSVFLRVLEYHSGVLILTTNRIRSFDDAFLSRFSIALRYPDLDRDSRKVLWSKFLVLAGASVETNKSTSSPKAITLSVMEGTDAEGITTPRHFSLMDINKLSLKNLNGRVIKQTVRTAQALAVSAGEQLSMSHVETVLRISDQFAEDWKELEFGDNPGTESGQKNMYA